MLITNTGLVLDGWCSLFIAISSNSRIVSNCFHHGSDWSQCVYGLFNHCTFKRTVSGSTRYAHVQLINTITLNVCYIDILKTCKDSHSMMSCLADSLLSHSMEHGFQVLFKSCFFVGLITKFSWIKLAFLWWQILSLATGRVRVV